MIPRRYNIEIVYTETTPGTKEEPKSFRILFGGKHANHKMATADAEEEFRVTHPDAHIWCIASEAIIK